MTDSVLLSRIQLCFDGDIDNIADDLSAVAFTPDGNLWLGCDEGLYLERLSPVGPSTFGCWQQYDLGDFIPFCDRQTEVDIEGIDYCDGYLWLVGSHSTKRKKPKGRNEAEDLTRLAEVTAEANRYLLARLPIAGGEPVASYRSPDQPEVELTAAALERTETGNILMDALSNDPHLGKIIACGLPSKENGLDIEGLAVRGKRIFLGLRGPVLRGWAVLLEIEPIPGDAGLLQLAPIGANGEFYKKHFLNLDGLGLRDLCPWGEGLLVLAGPTLDSDGPLKVFFLNNIFEIPGDSLSDRDTERLQLLFNLPAVSGADRAEGLSLYPTESTKEALLVIYDSPDARRRPRDEQVLADVFQLP